MDITALFPRLLPGVSFTWEESHIYIGYRHRGVEVEIQGTSFPLPSLISLTSVPEVPSLHEVHEVHEVPSIPSVPEDRSALTSPLLVAMLTHCLGELSTGEIFRKISAAADLQPELTELLTRLSASGFLVWEKHSSKSKLLRAVNEMSTHGRMLPEINLTRSLESIRERSSKSILIFGENRLAHHLTTLLRASGFGVVKRIDRREVDRRDTAVIHPQITPQEVIGLAFRQSDVGLDRANVLSELEAGVNIHEHHKAQKSKAEQDFPSIPSFIISTYETQPDYRYRWMNEAIPHLLISSLADHQIDIGPIVIPGESACGRCIEIAESSVNPIYRKWRLREMHSIGTELTAATVSALGGLIVLELIQFFSGGSTLMGRSKRFDLHNAMSPVDMYWAPQPECGCTELN